MAPPRVGSAGRTAALLLLPAAALAAATGAWLQREDARAERRLLEGRAGTLAEALLQSVGDAMAEHHRERMASILEAIARTEGVAGVAIAGADGTVRFVAGEAPARVEAVAERRWSEARLVVTKPISNEASCRACHGAGEANGAVLVSLDASPLGPRLAASARRNALLAVLSTLATARAYPWPGNVRELRNVCERAVLMGWAAVAPILGAGSPADAPSTAQLVDFSLPLLDARQKLVERFEREYLVGLLREHRGRIGEVARAAGIAERNLYEKMKAYGLSRDDYR